MRARVWRGCGLARVCRRRICGDDGSGLFGAGLAAFFKVPFNGFFAFFFLGLFFLSEGFLDGAVAFLIIEFAEIVGFAFAQAWPLPGGGILFHVCWVCCFTTVVRGEGTKKIATRVVAMNAVVWRFWAARVAGISRVNII